VSAAVSAANDCGATIRACCRKDLAKPAHAAVVAHDPVEQVREGPDVVATARDRRRGASLLRSL
jgi:hypothetical protein